jgi:hypothetical protein
MTPTIFLLPGPRYICCTTRFFWNILHHVRSKPNKLLVFRSNKTKGPKQIIHAWFLTSTCCSFFQFLLESVHRTRDIWFDWSWRFVLYRLNDSNNLPSSCANICNLYTEENISPLNRPKQIIHAWFLTSTCCSFFQFLLESVVISITATYVK